jgi:hypothetical protein
VTTSHGSLTPTEKKEFSIMAAFKSIALATVAAIALAGCAGRAPTPVAVVQPFDNQKDCTAIMAEIGANNQRISELGSEQGAKVAQNVVAGLAGLFVPVLWFGMDFQGAASTETSALQARQQYLAALARQHCATAALPYGGQQ